MLYRNIESLTSIIVDEEPLEAVTLDDKTMYDEEYSYTESAESAAESVYSEELSNQESAQSDAESVASSELSDQESARSDA